MCALVGMGLTIAVDTNYAFCMCTLLVLAPLHPRPQCLQQSIHGIVELGVLNLKSIDGIWVVEARNLCLSLPRHKVKK